MTIQTLSLTDKQYVEKVFHMLAANTDRTKLSFTVIFIGIHPLSSFYQSANGVIEEKGFLKAEQFIETKIRKSDMLFPLSNRYGWLLILSSTGEEEGKAFLNRLFENGSIEVTETEHVLLSASLIEVATSKVNFEELADVGMETIFSAFEKGPFQYIVVDQYKKKEIETIKVSILEDDELMQDLLKNVMERIAGEYFRVGVKLFQDGDSFLNSNWYHSSDTHVVIVNDVLKKRNGLEILHTLRRMPNHKKYIIIMLTKRRSEEDMLYVFEQGADEYIRKPFDIRLIEAKIKSLLRRLRL